MVGTYLHFFFIVNKNNKLGLNLILISPTCAALPITRVTSAIFHPFTFSFAREIFVTRQLFFFHSTATALNTHLPALFLKRWVMYFKCFNELKINQKLTVPHGPL